MTASILLFGATGFVGGAVLHRLLTADKHHPHVVVLVSSRDAADRVAAWAKSLDRALDVQVLADAAGDNTNPERPSLSARPRSLDIVPAARSLAQAWYETAQHYASCADTAIQVATSDDLELTKAIDRGLAQAKARGRRGTIVHASGVQLIESAPVGKFIETPVYDDTDIAQIRAISDSAAHRHIDLEIARDIAAGTIGGGAIICSALIWGISNGPVRRISQQVPGMVEKALSPLNRQAVYAGTGLNEWNAVHIEDLADLILALVHRWTYDELPTAPSELFSTFYFAGNNGLFTFKEVAEAIGEVLFHSRITIGNEQQPLVTTPTAKSVPVPRYDASQKGVRVEDDGRAATADEDEQRAPSWPCRTNSRCVSKRAEREFGWVARRVFDKTAMVEEVKAYLRIWQDEGVLEKKVTSS